MSSRHPQITPSLQVRICSYVRAGGYPHVAAEAAGVPRSVFEKWIRRADRPRAPQKVRALVQGIRQAEAERRLKAEMVTFENDPLTWLRSGPGKETFENPGWSAPPRAHLPAESERMAMLFDHEAQALIGLLLEILTPFPEVKGVVSDGLERP